MKRILKISSLFFIIIILLVFFSTVAFAEGNYDELFEMLGSEQLVRDLPDEVTEMFEQLGINKIDFDSVFNVKAEDVIHLVKNLLTGNIESPLKSLFRLLCIIIMLAVCNCFVPDDGKYRLFIEMCGALLSVISIVSPLNTSISAAISSVSVTGKFMLILIPVLTAVVSASGNPGLAVSFQSVAFVAAQLISGFAVNFLIPLVGAILALDITGSMMPTFKMTGLTDFIKKSISCLLSVCATVYVSFLGLKGALANAADTLATKSIKLVISSAVPVVGGALSEAYSGVVGSMVLFKSTIGVFGICAIALINLPSCVQILFWTFTLKVAYALSELFELRGLSVMFNALSSTLVLLNVILLFVAVLFIISTALILVIKAG